MCKVPFSTTDESGKMSGIDTTRILEKVIVGAITATVIGFGSWFMFVEDMRSDQKIIKKEMSTHIQVTDKRHIEFVQQNKNDHQSIINDNKVMYQHVMDEMKEITHELRGMRKDLYIPANGHRK